MAFVIFAITFSLFQIPIKAVLYAFAIVGFLGIIVFLLSYKRAYSKNQQLTRLQSEIALSIDNLPNTSGFFEEEYQTLLRILFAEKLELTNKTNTRYDELIDYYTTWVHQIKTPIASMQLYLQNAKGTPDYALVDDLQRIEQYVEMVLCYLRLDSEFSDFVFHKYDLDQIIKQAVKRFSRQFIQRKITLEYEPLQYQVLTDEKWLLFVIEQILSNSLKYTKEGKISITIDDSEVLTITDTGQGIAPEDLPRIFQKGYTGYNGRINKKSSGIGLYLCYRICQKLGHSISVESKIGCGTTIHIKLRHDHVEI